MINSDEEFFWDFEADEKGTHISVFRVEDTISETSTLTASEDDSNGYNSPTPPLFCKLRKARVLVKKLPQSVLAKYNLNCKESATSTLVPVRASKRVGEKRTPGQYLSLHINKSITEIANKKKRLANTYLKQKLGKQQKLFQKKKYELPHAGYSKRSTIQGKTYPTGSIQKSYDKSKPTNQINVNKIKRLQVVNSNKEDSSNRRSLHERIACTRLINADWRVNNPISASSNFSNVVIKKCNISQNNLIGNSYNPTLPLSNFKNNYVPPTYITSDKTAPKLLQKNNNQVPFPLGTIISNNTHLQNGQASKPVEPTTDSHNISDLLICNKAASTSNIGFQQPNNFTQTSTTKAFRVLHHLSSNNESVIVNTPKLLIINRPPLVTDPLNIAKSSSSNNRNGPETSQVGKDISVDTESETDLDLSDVDKVVEPEVIKRIIYHTKSVQTKFTCNSSICGLVDSEEFSLNCFYCYDIFPLHKWYEFKEHIKRVHHLEEKKNKSDSNEYINNSTFQDSYPSITSQQSLKKSTINKEIAVINPTKAKEQILKKLPLDPKLVAQRSNGSKQDKISYTKNTKPYFPKNSNQFKQLSKSKIQRSNVHSSNNIVNEVINLDSDDDVHEKETDSKRATTKNKYLNINNCIQQNSSASEFILPTLPHITVKRIAKLPSKAPKVKYVELQKPLSTMGSPCLKNLVNKLPSNLNVQRSKTVPKPTTQQLLVDESKKPRYFIVKKIIKLPPIEKMDNQNIPKSMTDTAISNPTKGNSIKMSLPERLHTTKMLSLEKRDTTKMSIPEKLNTSKMLTPEKSDDTRMSNGEKSDDDMPSSDEVEDSVPKPTNGRGILFGVTNSMVVIEFLLKLKTFPELWRSQLKNNTSNNYSHSIREMCCHLNNRFDLKIVDSEMRQSIRRVRNWYSRMLKNIYEHNINLNNTAPYKHKFPLYFRILNQFLTSDVDYSHNISLATSKSEEIRPKLNISDHFKVPLPAKITSVTTCATSKTKANNTSNTDVSVENLIQFDADTLCEKGVLKEFDDTKTDVSKKKHHKDCIGNFECDVCHKTYKRIYELRRHKTLHFPPQFQCGICSQKFYFKHWAEKCSHLKKKYRTAVKTSEKDKSTDTLQQKRVWPKKIFRFKMICEVCGASYRSIGSLNTHKRDKHLNQRAKCVVCNFTALSKWRVVQHQKKRHIVEPGTVEDVAKKTRPRTDTKTPFSNEAKQEFLWRREMRKKLKPGEIFYGCCKCRIVFNSRKEKVFHNKLEHPIKETTVVCLLCLPNKLLLSNSNSARRHYTDIHKVPWHEIDALVKRTKPIFSFLNKEEVEILKASENYKELLDEFLKDKNLQSAENYKELLDEFLKDKNLQSAENIELLEDDTLDAVHNLPLIDIDGRDEKVNKTSEECTQGDNVHVDCIIDHDYNSQELFDIEQSVHSNEHNYSEELSAIEIYDNDAVNNENKNDFYSDTYDDGIIQLDYYIEESDKIYNSERNDQEYLQSMVDDFIVEELVEESIVSEEFIDEVIEEEKDFFS